MKITSKTNRIGSLLPRYSYIQNIYPEYRFSKCPKCKNNTWNRKFPLLIFVSDICPLALGLTCKYCSKCELIIAHQHELENELADLFSSINPQAIGKEYFVIVTVNKKVWKNNIGKKSDFTQYLEHISDFKEKLDFHYTPGGWYKSTK